MGIEKEGATELGAGESCEYGMKEGHSRERGVAWSRGAAGTNGDGRARSSDSPRNPTVRLSFPDLSLSPEEEDSLPKPPHLPADPLSGWHRRAGLPTVCCH